MMHIIVILADIFYARNCDKILIHSVLLNLMNSYKIHNEVKTHIVPNITYLTFSRCCALRSSSSNK